MCVFVHAFVCRAVREMDGHSFQHRRSFRVTARPEHTQNIAVCEWGKRLAGGGKTRLDLHSTTQLYILFAQPSGK